MRLIFTRWSFDENVGSKEVDFVSGLEISKKFKVGLVRARLASEAISRLRGSVIAALN
jgi:hypothetical protein